MAAGYSAKVHELGWRLLHLVSGYAPEKQDLSLDKQTREAINELDRWDEQGFRRIHAALSHLHPAQDEHVFKDLKPSEGMESVLGVSLLLDRLDELENGKAREATREADHAALATLAERGITPDERKRLRELVKKAQAVNPVVPISEAGRKQYEENLVALRGWYDDWSETARAVITRRDHLISLGLAKRKKKEKAPNPLPATPSVPVKG